MHVEDGGGVMERVVVGRSSPGMLEVLIEAIANHELDVIFTSSLDEDTARWVAVVMVQNYRDVAGIVVDARDRWPFESAMFLHVLDKEHVVRRVDEIRMYNNGGRVV